MDVLSDVIEPGDRFYDALKHSAMAHPRASGIAREWAVWVLGCSRSHCRAQDPDQVLRDFAAAVRNGDAGTAWAMLSEETKRTTTFEAFRGQLLRDPRQAEELAALVERPIGPPQVSAQVGGRTANPSTWSKSVGNGGCVA